MPLFENGQITENGWQLAQEGVALPEGETASDEVGLPIERDNLLLPCGESGRWTPKR